MPVGRLSDAWPQSGAAGRVARPPPDGTDHDISARSLISSMSRRGRHDGGDRAGCAARSRLYSRKARLGFLSTVTAEKNKSIVADEIRNRSKRQRPPNWVRSAKMMSRSTPSWPRRAASGGRLGSVASANIISCLPRFWLRRAVVWSGRGFRNGRSQAGDTNCAGLAQARSIVANIWRRTLRTRSKSNSADAASRADYFRLSLLSQTIFAT
jgi:hypothetical protein